MNGDGPDELPQFLPHPVEVSEQKIRNYLLDTSHRDGGPKARFFIAKGFSRADWGAFATAVKYHPVANPIHEQEATEYGLKVVIQCIIQTPDGSNPCILTVWMVEEQQAPRLVTAYPLKN